MGMFDVVLFRWYPHADGRHAIPNEALVGRVVRTLCGLEVPVRRGPEFKCEPECVTCDNAWRRAIGVPTRDELLAHAVPVRVPSARRSSSEATVSTAAPELAAAASAR